MEGAEHYIIVVKDVSRVKRIIKLLKPNIRAIAILALLNEGETGKLGGIKKNYDVVIMKGYLPLPSSTS